MLLVCGAIFIWLNDTAVQKWNKTSKASDDPKEMKPLAKNVAEEENKDTSEKKEERTADDD